MAVDVGDDGNSVVSGLPVVGRGHVVLLAFDSTIDIDAAAAVIGMAALASIASSAGGSGWKISGVDK
jgi:hypothetical protein